MGWKEEFTRKGFPRSPEVEESPRFSHTTGERALFGGVKSHQESLAPDIPSEKKIEQKKVNRGRKSEGGSLGLGDI